MSESPRREAGAPAVMVLASTYPRWAGDPEPGFVHELSRRLATRMRVIAVVPDSPGADDSGNLDGVEVVRYRYAPRKLQTLVNNGGVVANLKRSPWKWFLVPSFVIGQWWAARRVVKQTRIDVVHAHWIVPQGLVAGGLGRPVLVTSHGADLFALNGSLAMWLKRRALRRCTAMTVVSSAMVAPAKALLPPGISPRVSPMGVDLAERFAPCAAVERSSSELLFVGRLVEKKGLAFLIEALPRILASHPDARLSIVGFGPEESALRAQVAREGLDEHVRFLGPVKQSELPHLYRRAAVFVAPFVEARSGDQEGLGLVVVEALGTGCPVVTTRIPAVAEVFEGVWPAFTVAPEDSEGLANAIVGVLGSPQRAREEAKDWAIRVRERFEWSYVAAGYRAELCGLVAGRRAP